LFLKKKKRNFEERIPDPSTNQALETSKKWLRKKKFL